MAVNGYSPGRGMLTPHGMVLLCIARDPTVRLKDMAAKAGCAPRFAYTIMEDLEEAGMISRRKEGRRNIYVVHLDAPLGEKLAGTVADFVRALG